MAKGQTVTVVNKLVNNAKTPTTVNQTVEPDVEIHSSGGKLVAPDSIKNAGVVLNNPSKDHSTS